MAKKRSSNEINEYEMQKYSTIEANAKTFEELGLYTLAKQLMDKKGMPGKKGKEKYASIDEDQEYVHDGEDFKDEGFSDHVNATSTHEIGDLSDCVGQKKQKKQKKRATCPAMSMEEFLKMQQENESNNGTQHPGREVPERHRTEIRSSARLQAIRLLENQRESVEQSTDLLVDVEEVENEAVNDDVGEKKKNTRGPTMLHHVHNRKLEDRVPIFFNEAGQPIGPTDKALNEFSIFLGTLAKDHSWAPLIYVSWDAVPDQNEMWEYVNKKYILPPIAKKWVMETVDSSWKIFKCLIKKEHYYKYDNDVDRWKNRPSRVPDEHFRILLRYWNTDEAKKISAINSANRSLQTNMHTAGPVTFARIYQKLTQNDGKPPSKRKMFEETRRRKEGRTYKQSYDDTRAKIEKIQQMEAAQEGGDSDSHKDPFEEVMPKEHPGRVRLLGKGVSTKVLKEKKVGSSLVLPTEVIESIRAMAVESMQAQLVAEKEDLAKEKEAQALQFAEMKKMSKELEDQAAKLAEMRKNFQSQKESLAMDVVEMAYTQLSEMAPSMSSEELTRAIASAATSKLKGKN